MLRVENCVLQETLEPTIRDFFRRQFGRFSSHEEDLVQEILQALLLTPDGTYHFKKPQDFIHWLPMLLRRRVIDFLRKVRLIPRPRCGACAHYSKRHGCMLDQTRSVTPSTNPRNLQEPCDRFQWSGPVQSLPPLREAVAREEPIGDEGAKELLERAMAELERRDDRGRRAVRAIRLHRLEGRTMMEAGAILGVSHMSIKRAVDSGIRELRPILERLIGDRLAS